MCRLIAFVLFSVACAVPSPTGYAQAVAEVTAEINTEINTAPNEPTHSEQIETKKFASFRDACSAAYELKNERKWEASRDAYLAAIAFDSTPQEKCDVYRSLVTVYSELKDWDAMYEATEYVVENAPYPSFSSLTVRAMTSHVSRSKTKDAFFKRYEDKLEANAKDRTALTILASGVRQLTYDPPRRAEYLRRLVQLDKAEGKSQNSELRTQLAFALRLSKKEVESAEMYQAISDSHKDYRSYCLAQAAVSWEKEKAIAAAINASNLGPDVKAKRSLYNWHRMLADLFLQHLAKAPALKHYTAALEHATIDPYREQCRDQIRLVQALKD